MNEDLAARGLADNGAGFVVAIDGPAGSGKSSVSRAVALELGFAYLDTGAAYRALAWLGSKRGADLQDPSAVIALLPEFDFTISTDPSQRWVRMGDSDVATEIRNPEISQAVSSIASVPEVRTAINATFRAIMAASVRGIVVEGRDITTVVAPDAPVRILLTADPAVRAKRRALESGRDADLTSAEIAARDGQDSKTVDFMAAAAGVTTVDSTAMTFQETVDAITGLVTAKRRIGEI